ncbi:iron-sulfur cluster assembly accessory protein [Rickettsiales bacterium]|nr:iron-sulfur cluster assembly accessory protein [Rickettsiales bacterium]
MSQEINFADQMKNLKHNHSKVDYINITDDARDYLTNGIKEQYQTLLDEKKENASKLRGVKLNMPSGKCGAVSYKIEYAYEDINIEEEDEVLIIEDKINIFINPIGSFMVFGMVMDYYDNGIEYGFKFINPNETGKCECGTSFYIS